MNPRLLSCLLILGLLGGLLPSHSAQADVIVYKNGKVIKGLSETIPGEPDFIRVTTEMGTLRIQRARIERIEEEPPAIGYIHIGDAHRNKGDFAAAMRMYQQALDLDPDNARARALIDETQAQIDQEQQLNRDQAIMKIDEIAQQAHELIENNNHEEAEALLQNANDMVPTEEQRQQLQKLISELYLSWAEARLDKLDKNGAERYLNLAVAANPENEAAIDHLLQLWEDNPAKREQSANVYETILEQHPDNQALRLKLAEIYHDMDRFEDALHHYLQLYTTSEKYAGTQVEDRLVELLDRMHRQYAREKQWDKAIKHYNMLATLDPNTDPTAVLYYQLFKRVSQLAREDYQQRLELAQWAEENGLDQYAEETYRELAESDEASQEVQDAAQTGLNRFAQRQFEVAQIHFQNGQYSLARTLADQVRQNYPGATQVVEEASQLIGKATVEVERERRQRGEIARTLVERGDEYYAQANFHFNNLFNTERANNPRLISDRREAIKYYSLAIDAYQEALNSDPTLSQDPRSLVNIRLLESRQRLARLTQEPTRRNFGRPLIRD